MNHVKTNIVSAKSTFRGVARKNIHKHPDIIWNFPYYVFYVEIYFTSYCKH